MKIKDAHVKIKAGPDDGLADGEFTAYASVFGNRDSYGDVVEPGAFTATLADWKTSGDPIPLLWGHNMADPDFNLGAVLDAVQDEKGLLVTAQLDLDSPKAAQTYRLLKGRRVRQMSFAYDVEEGKQDGEDFRLKKLKLHEVSIVPLGANQEAEILAVKAAQELERINVALKAGRVFSAKNEAALRAIADQAAGMAKDITDLLSAIGETADQDKASTSEPAKDARPDQATPEAPTRRVSVDTWATDIHLLELEIAR